ncbi:MAG: hypothetical protein KME08_01390 [Aphanothece sp. CMT-3BRIN-NPC111]|nr:hypothetical protein [Aphanothece sp. CMT-3BRIN-NPC111]
MATVLGSANVILSAKYMGAPGDGTVLTEDKITEDTKVMIMPKTVDNPEPVWKANKDTPKDKLFDINKKIDHD